MGRSARRLELVGFLVGADVIAQRERFVEAAERGGDGELVHPTLGRLNVALIEISFEERHDRGRYIELRMALIETGERAFPTISASTADQTTAAADRMDSTAQLAYVSRMERPLSFGGLVTDLVKSATGDWGAKILALGNDATGLFGLSSLLPGNFGLYWGGNGLASASGLLFGLRGTFSTVAQLMTGGANARGVIATAFSTLVEGALGIDLSSCQPFAIAAQGLMGALMGAVSSPRDAIRMALSAAAFAPVYRIETSPVGVYRDVAMGATGDLFRRAAVVSAARASAAWQPANYSEAITVRDSITTVMDAEITVAGDQGEDDAYRDLQALRVAVARDLTARAADLAVLVRIETREPMPALAMAYRLYQDTGREAELTLESGTPHPAFLSTSFLALSS